MPRPPRVLFATSNGTGLGHLNRAMAIARRLPHGSDVSLFTLSQAAPVVAGAGFDVDYLSSYRRPASGTDRAWNQRLRAVLEELIDERSPDLVVFDGVHPYRAVTHVLSRRDAPPSIWCRRPMWRQGSATAPLRRSGAFDLVLEPGELAAGADRGPTVAERPNAVRVDPIVYLDPEELLDRPAAAAELGLDPDRRTALVSLGQGGELDRAVARTLAALAARSDIQVAALQSSIAEGLDVPAGVVHLRSTFPMSRYFRAFDMAIAAPGYNAFHELIAFGVPSLFLPMERNTDDQRARARWAAAEGVALAVDGAGDSSLEERIAELCDPGRGAELRAASERAFPGNGAGAAAGVVAAVAGGKPGRESIRDRGPLNRWLRLSSHPVGPTLPLVLALGARDLLRHPERRSPRLVVLALGVPDGELIPRLRRAIGGEDPARVLVLTDSLAFAEMRGLGVAFERIPVASTHEAGLALLHDRAATLLRGRRPLRAVSIGRWGPEVLGLPAQERE
jgi:UDP-N-acetylglucosamine--N-acetylmuramyl-(pentapeptide) pyrophosphoryl-undecaprenol N-acetylglucosamine transferase